MNVYYRYEVDKRLLKDEYSIFDTTESRYLAEGLKKDDAELIAEALNRQSES
ncbi:hypothetical protein SAMN04487895_101592 [Paenibacillus sophorae]|uniref:Uncharacterized protein n=1 Tax=Paenibacillus sophorae TaxID=1333845 RepID=A0A1H8GPS7_9BACL|nr:hypothetical protein [Paenibacillus sophorae]QWU14293.1 hypothetical protein KP014_20515 [Paenibacillus sophorae]SEN45734.1 hypothetical protein SAMN04487895_101592 [Paenibacillus sophorae]